MIPPSPPPPPPPKPSHLSPSQLGSKEYWDKTYTADLTTHALNPQHTGTTWFSDTLASAKTLNFLLALSRPSSLSRAETSFLDLGTGNGEMLFRLREQGGFRGRMLGVDYSPASVELARRIAIGKGIEVEFRVWDILRGSCEGLEEEEKGGEGKVVEGVEGSLGRGREEFDVVLDKGTFDAVSLNAELDGAGRRVCEGYRERVEGLVRRNGGRLVVTSCNWTEEELRGWFEEGELVFEERIEYPRFHFGGQTGQSVSGVCFRRK